MIKITKNLDEANCITHAGTFHADDIFATVFLEKVFNNIIVCRVNEIENLKKLNAKIIYDIGKDKFDHHQIDAPIRENNIKYSSVGLLFKEYGLDYLKKKKVFNYKKVYSLIEKDLIMQIDAIDNGIFPNYSNNYVITTISDLVSYFNKNWDEEIDNDECFLKAVLFFKDVWEKIENRIVAKVKAESLVKKAITKGNEILILDKYLPYKDYVLEYNDRYSNKIKFVIFPSNRGGYAINAVKKSVNSNENIIDFPNEWGGKSASELKNITNIKTFRFCHKDLFCAACDNLEDAVRVAKEAIKKKN